MTPDRILLPNRPLTAAGLMLIAALLIGFTDNFVVVIAREGGLWQFHVIRSAIALPLLAVAARGLGQRLMPRRWGGVVLRSALHSAALMIYFGCLAFLSVAQVSAALFTAPIFVLVISRLFFAAEFGLWRVIAVLLGFAGIVVMLRPEAGAIGLVSVMPVAAAVLYAIGNIATRAFCAGESAVTLTAGFFAGLFVWGLAGLMVLTVFPLAAPSGPEGFVLRGWGVPSATFLAVTLMQAVFSLVAVALMVRAYQIAEASQVAVFEYMLLISGAAWGAVLWGQRFDAPMLAGMVAIIASGAIIALRARRPGGAMAEGVA